MVDIVEGGEGGWAIRIRGIAVAMLPTLEQAKFRTKFLVNPKKQKEVNVHNKDGQIIEIIRY
ncbi:hypothetical protein [Mesoplasma florum]|uniref:hypothetical protein n=1 Tax=Mesoplasma florum TaxID=2151 RepID=UPI000D02ADD8|nr:hypothetical protein [Mesoplasma florum]AVN58904.1 hypothetical protein CG009_01525 [Mesoplasma florum]